MNKLKEFYNNYLSHINKYVVVVVIFLVLITTTGDSSFYNRYMYDEKIRSLENEIEHYRKEIEVNSQKLKELRTDKEGLERFAREEYLMKRDNEDVFIIK